MSQPERTHDLARRRHTRQLISVSATVFVMLTMMAVLEDSGDGPIDTGWLGVRLAINAAAMIVVTLGMLGLRRAGVRWLQPSPTMGLDREQRRAASGALRPGGDVAPEHRASTLAVARDLRRYRWSPWFFLLIGVMNSYAFATEPGPVRWIYGAGGVIGLLFAGYYVVALRKARAIESAASEFGTSARSGGDGTPA